MRKLRGLIAGLMVVAPAIAAVAQAGESENSHRFEVGAQLPILRSSQPAYSGMVGVGGRFGYTPKRYVTVEGEYNILASQNNDVYGQQYAVFGAKAGWRTPQIGVFAKVRPGFMTFRPSPYGIPTTSGTKPMLEIGGVVELYSPRLPNLYTRFDMGDAVVFFGSPLILPNAVRPSRDATVHNVQITLGIGVRF